MMVILHVTVVLLLITMFTPVRSSYEGITTDLEPSGSLYKTVGESLELICSYKGVTSNNSSDSLSIERCRHRKCFLLSSEAVNLTTIRTTIQSLHLEDTGTYTCNFPPDPDSMSILFLRVGYRPSPPKDIYCFSKDHLDMNCTVTLADRDARSELGHNVTIDFQSDRSTEWLKCLHYDAQTYSCYWRSPAETDSSGIDFLNDFSLLERYIVRARVRNILGSSQAIKIINDSSTIVTISKLYHLSVTSITSRTASLTWELPEYVLPGIFTIDFAINYTSRWDRHPRQLLYSTKERMRTELVGLVPYTKYYVSIRARGRLVTDDRSWTPVERLSFHTDKDAPSAAPKYTVGGYFLSRPGINNTGDNCALQIYLKPLPQRKRNGKLAGMYYSVSIQGDTHNQLITRPLTTLTIRDISCWNDRPYNIAVQACIEDDLCSNNRTVIHIPSFAQDIDTGFPHATEVIAEGYGDTAVKVSWLSDAQFQTIVKNVTVFWCRGNRELTVCKSNLSWTILPGDATETMLNLTHSYYRDWMFAVSSTTDEGVSGGMVFDDCQFLYDSTEEEHTAGGKRNPDSSFGSVKPSFNLLARDGDVKSIDVVSFTFRYCDAQFLLRKPDQYEVFYRVTTEETEGDCTTGAHSLNVTATLRVQEIVLPDLDPMAQYSVCMRIWTSVGASELSDVKWRKPLKLPGARTSDSALIISITLAIVITLVVLSVIIWRVCHTYKSMDVKVQVPVIDNYSDEDQRLMEAQSQQDRYAVKDDGIRLTSKGNTALSNGGLGKPRKPLPAPSLLAASKRNSSDSGVVRSSLESQQVDGRGDNIFQATPNGVSGETAPNKCEFSMIAIPKKCISHGSRNNDGRVKHTDSSVSTSDSAADYQPGITQNNTTIGEGSYCQWDAIGTIDSRLSSHCPVTDNDATENSGVSDITEYRQIGSSNSNAVRDNDASSGQTTSFQDQAVPEGSRIAYVIRNEQFDNSFTEQYNPLLPMGESTRVIDTNVGAVTNRRCGKNRRPRDIGSPMIRSVTTSETDTCDFYDSSMPTENNLDLGIECNNSYDDINEVPIGENHEKGTILEDFNDEKRNLLHGHLQTFDHEEDYISQIQHARLFEKACLDVLSTASVGTDHKDQLLAYLEPDKSVTCLEPNSGHSFTCLEQEAYTSISCLEPVTGPSVTCLEPDTDSTVTCLETDTDPSVTSLEPDPDRQLHV
ncbi:uncharacterized protein LOC110461763 [Mizuhopecten yessoensis]|uniref:uncharacterized protein LOC110461763 n=1 Tax=Mizuhopecten yessoensis TaxID=6573 RepID=UPI000B459239|nr:uncharacterized protein LOC110461763 [Mizuhopecten yessoensis]